MKKLLLSTALISLVGFNALAQSTATTEIPAAVSVTEQKPAEATESKSLPFTLGTTHIYNGAMFKDPLLEYSYDGEDSQQAIFIRNQIALGYKITDKIKLTPVLDFDLVTADAGSNSENQGFRMRDSFIKLSHGSLLTQALGTSELSLAGDIRYFVPTSKGSRDSDSPGGFRLSLKPSLQIGKTPFSIATVNFVRYWMQVQDKALPRLQLYTGPQLNYAINDKITAFVLYEANVMYDTKGNSNTATTEGLTDVNPGVQFQIHKMLSLSPSALWYPRLPISTTAFNLEANITLF